jgi:hypothetical protein
MGDGALRCANTPYDFLVMDQMLLIQVRLNRVSLQSLLQDYLLGIIAKGKLGQQLEKQVGQLTAQQVPVYRLKDFEQCTYRCSVAFAAAKRLSASPLEVAEEVWRDLGQQLSNCGPGEGLEFQVRLVAPGWLEFQLCNPLAWLAFVLQHPPQHLPCPVAQDQDFFFAQYAHARCCSLLRMAQSQNLVEYRFSSRLPRESEKVPLAERDLGGSFLQFFQDFPDPTERKLLGTLMIVIDGSNQLAPGEAVKQVKVLSHAMLAFYDRCRLWGEVQQENPELVQRRLALLAGVQIWLRWVLECGVGGVAPGEL